MDQLLEAPQADWTLIRAFIEVMRAGTLSAAARSLGAAQPTLGRQIRRLEALSGEPLFLRRGRELQPTDRARTLYEAAGQLEAEVTALGRAFSAGARGSGLVRITTSELFALYVLPRLLPPLLETDAGLEVEIVASDRLENLVRRDADIAIRFARPTQPELIAAKLGDISFGLYATEALFDRHGEPASLSDLLGWPWVSSADGSEVLDAFRDKGLALDPARLRLRAENLPLRLAAVEAGLGVGAVSDWMARRRPALKPVLPGMRVFTLPAWIVAHDDLHRSPRLRLVFDELRTAIRRVIAGEA